MLLAAAVVEDGLDWSRDGRQRPDPDGPDDAFEDRSVQIGTTFGGAGVIRGNLTPECAAAVRALLEALGKKPTRGTTAPRTNASMTRCRWHARYCPASMARLSCLGVCDDVPACGKQVLWIAENGC